MENWKVSLFVLVWCALFWGCVIYIILHVNDPEITRKFQFASGFVIGVTFGAYIALLKIAAQHREED